VRLRDRKPLLKFCQLLLSTRTLIQLAVFRNNKPPTELFPANFHANLKELLCQILAAHAKYAMLVAGLYLSNIQGLA
jgi:hypothetical protein